MLRSLLLSACLFLTFGWQVAAQAPSWTQSQALTSIGTVGYSGMALDVQGNRYVIGTFQSALTLAPGTTLTSRGATDCYIAKYDATGALLWVQQAGGSTADRITGIALDALGNAYIVGDFISDLQLDNYSVSTSLRDSHLFLALLNPQGQVQYLRQDGARAGFEPANCQAAGIALDAANNVYISGSITGRIGFGGVLSGTTLAGATNGDRDYMLVKYGVGQSVPEWARQGGRTPVNQRFYSPSLVVSPTGEAYLIGTFAPTIGGFGAITPALSRGSNDVGIVKYSSQGEAQWVQRSGGTGLDQAHYATLDLHGHLAVAAEFSATVPFGGKTLVSTGTRAGALLIYSVVTGEEQWGRVLTGSTQAYFHDVATDGAGNFYVAGSLEGSGTAEGTPLTSVGGSDAVLVSYSAQGTWRWQQQSRGVGNEAALGVRFSNNAQLQVSGLFDGTAQFGLITPLESRGGINTNLFLAQLSASTLAIRSTQAAQPLALFPNPAHERVRLPVLPAGTQVLVQDALGRVVRQEVAAATLSTVGLPSHLYWVQATGPDGQVWKGRLVVE
jgi:hypothetical protein